MYKILIFVAVIFSLSNSVKTEGCPSEYFDGKDNYCYHIGTKAMTQSEAKKYCESKNGSLAYPVLPAPEEFKSMTHYFTKYIHAPLKNRLRQIAKRTGDRKWWLEYCWELELVRVNKKKFRVNGLNCSKKRKPICEILYNH